MIRSLVEVACCVVNARLWLANPIEQITLPETVHAVLRRSSIGS